MLDQKDIERRLPVWQALSELFVDTALDSHAYGYIADQLCGCGYSIAEVETILRDEVTPAFSPNLVVAGEWTGWSEEDVKKIMLEYLEKQQAKGLSILEPLKRRVREWQMDKIADDWKKVKIILEQKEPAAR